MELNNLTYEVNPDETEINSYEDKNKQDIIIKRKALLLDDMIRRLRIISENNDLSDIQYGSKVMAILSDIGQQYFEIYK